MPPARLVQVVMQLAAQPVPPLPILAGTEVPDEISFTTGEHAVANSHDLWATLMLGDMQRGTSGEDACVPTAPEVLQQYKQHAEELLDQIQDIDGKEMTRGERETAVYDAYCAFTRACVHVLSSSQDLRFAPLDHVARGDPVHRAVCQHACTQDQIFGGLPTDPSGKRTADEYGEYSFPALLMRQYARLRVAERD